MLNLQIKRTKRLVNPKLYHNWKFHKNIHLQNIYIYMGCQKKKRNKKKEILSTSKHSKYVLTRASKFEQKFCGLSTPVSSDSGTLLLSHLSWGIRHRLCASKLRQQKQYEQRSKLEPKRTNTLAKRVISWSFSYDLVKEELFTNRGFNLCMYNKIVECVWFFIYL